MLTPTIAVMMSVQLMLSVAPKYRDIEQGITARNLARTDRGVQWKASDGASPNYDAAQVLDGKACDATGNDGYWAGNRWELPVTLELTFPSPTKIDTNVVVWYTEDIRGEDYKLEGLTDGDRWVELYRTRGNRMRDRVHRFAATVVSRVRFTLESAAGQNRVVMREFMLFENLSPADEKMLLENVARCLSPNVPSKVVRIGTPVKAVTYGNTQGTIGPSPKDGKPIFYMSYYNTGGADLLAYDMTSKEVFRYRLPSGSGGYGLTLGLDGKIYCGMVGRGNLVQFDPKTRSLRDLGNAGQPTQYVWACATAPDGQIFGAGYPKCIPLVYDPKTDKVSSPGSVSPKPGTDYLRYVVADKKGRGWFGVGTRAAIIVYDPADGSHRDILPAQYADQQMVYHLVRAGDEIYATLLHAGITLVFDANTCELKREYPKIGDGQERLLVCLADSTGNVYGVSSPGQHLWMISAGGSQPKRIHDHFGSPKALLDDRYLLSFFDNDARILDLKTGKIVDERKWIEPTEGMAIFTLTQGPGGAIYGSTYINQHFFRYEPEAAKLEDLGLIIRGGGQCDSIACSRDGKRVWMGCYAQAYLAVYDPARPYKLGTEPDANPRDFGKLGGGQYRTRDTVEGPDGRIYIGSIPSYNSSPNGALTIFDEKTLTKKQFTDWVPGGAVHCLASNDRYVYGSGGGKTFILDPQTTSKARGRDLACDSMLIGPDGSLIVSTSEAVHVLDPQTLDTRKTVPFSSVGGLKALNRIVADSEGTLYAIGNQGLVRIDLSSGKLIRLTAMASTHLAVDRKGRLYFSQGAELYMYDPKAK